MLLRLRNLNFVVMVCLTLSYPIGESFNFSVLSNKLIGKLFLPLIFFEFARVCFTMHLLIFKTIYDMNNAWPSFNIILTFCPKRS